MRTYIPYALLLFLSCSNAASISLPAEKHRSKKLPVSRTFDKNSWPYFLQHLPIIDTAVVDYKGQPVDDQDKHAGVIPYDIGKRDLQQCADAIMRLRAEYLFSEKRYDEIGFHFTGGQYYTFSSYCKGSRPVAKGNGVSFITKAACTETHEALRNYLDIVYTYAGTISLSAELKTASEFEVGTVVIYAGSPGHCFIIIDEATNEAGEKVLKLAEGYTPAQSIYVLRNPEKEGKDPWYKLSKGTITTTSYRFTKYKMGKFE